MGTHERREREKEQRRRDILDAARQCFWKQGYTQATMPQIARAAELAPGTLYLYFPSKSALYVELLVEGYDVFIPRLRERVAECDDPRAQVEALIDAFFDFARECPEYFNIIFFLLQQEGQGPRQASLGGDLLERVQAKENECKAIAGEVLHGLRPGRSDAGEGGGTAAVDAMWSMLAGVVFFFRGDGPDALAAVTTEARRIILNAILGGAL